MVKATVMGGPRIWSFPGKKRFPTLATILLVLSILWILGDLGYLPKVPWFPVVLFIIALGWITNNYRD